MSVVYFVAVGFPPEAVKIGYTCDLRSRLDSIQTGNHLPVRLLGTVPGGAELEKALHRRFAHLRLQGEWFRWEAELATVIADVPYSGLTAGDAFVGILGKGYPRSFYRAFVQDSSGQWWRFETCAELAIYDPAQHQKALGARAAPTFYGKLADAARFDGKPENDALLRLLARARELAT